MGRTRSRPASRPCLDTVRTREGRRRPRRVRHRSGRRRHLPARLPRRPRDARPAASGSPTGSAPRPDEPRARRPARRRSGLRLARPQQRPRRLRPLRPARRSGPVPAGRLRRDPPACRRSTRSPCSGIGSGLGADGGGRPRPPLRPGRHRRVRRDRRRLRSSPRRQAAIEQFRAAMGVDEQLEQIGATATSWRKVARRAEPDLEPADGESPGALLARLRERRAERAAQAGIAAPPARRSPHPSRAASAPSGPRTSRSSSSSTT